MRDGLAAVQHYDVICFDFPSCSSTIKAVPVGTPSVNQRPPQSTSSTVQYYLISFCYRLS